jgi:tetratricopeptide (TPR) repeat protein
MYSYLHVNFGILKNAQNKPQEAEQFFRNGIRYGGNNPEAYYFYADYLYKHGRKAEALPLVERCIALSPAHTYARYLAMTIYSENYQWEELKRVANETLAILPGDMTAKSFLDIALAKKTQTDRALELAQHNPTADNFLSLSLQYYRDAEYEKCIDAARQSLKLKADYAEAWNNIGSAYNQLGQFDSAQTALQRALRLKPGYELAQNNLKDVLGRKENLDKAMALVKSKPVKENYLNLSLAYYTSGLYEKCITAARSALQLDPGYADAWNNICSAYNQMKKWDEAIAAGEQAVKLRPDYALAQNNLNFARVQKQMQDKH